MNPRNPIPCQRGVALVVSLLFLLVLTLISVTAARNGSLNLRMAANMQDMTNSFQSAEAGAMATLGLAGAGAAVDDPFRVQVGDPNDPVGENPFATGGLDSVYMGNLRNGPDSVGVNVAAVSRDRPCPRSVREMGGSSFGQQVCTYFRVRAEHADEGRSRSTVELGVVKTTIQ